ncbi:unnamed protein product [Orchesella dallaii]|uniref:Uncharacterized protein n=1 Tax=Orchesella dallaii TaxID=48710 RepID=A0ABP1R267_9HEXA
MKESVEETPGKEGYDNWGSFSFRSSKAKTNKAPSQVPEELDPGVWWYSGPCFMETAIVPGYLCAVVERQDYDFLSGLKDGCSMPAVEESLRKNKTKTSNSFN